MLTREEEELLERLKKPLFSLDTTPEEALAYINNKYKTNFKSLREFNIASGFVKYYDAPNIIGIELLNDKK